MSVDLSKNLDSPTVLLFQPPWLIGLAWAVAGLAFCAGFLTGARTPGFVTVLAPGLTPFLLYAAFLPP